MHAAELQPVNDESMVSGPVPTASKDDSGMEKSARIENLRYKGNLVAELNRREMDVEVIADLLGMAYKSRIMFPAPRDNESEKNYAKRAKRRILAHQFGLFILVLFILVSLGSIVFTGNELIRKPQQAANYQVILQEEYSDTLTNTHLPVDPIDPTVPDWLWSSFSPSWYIEDAVYSQRLDSSDQDIELLSYLREKKAVIEREIEPAYSNDKIQNRLRDPDIIYFGSDYRKSLRRFVNTVLTVHALAREDNNAPNLDTVFNSKRRADLISQITLPKPPEPNEFYDSRVASMIDEIDRQLPLVSDQGGLISPGESEHDRMIGMLDDLYIELGADEFANLSDNGLGGILRRLPYGWGSTNLTRAFYENKRSRFVDWQILETRLLMLDLIYAAAKLPQQLPLVDLYLYHLGGEGFQQLFNEYRSKKLLGTASDWVEDDIAGENPASDRENRFIENFTEAKLLKLEEGDNERAILSLFYKAARFEAMYAKVSKKETSLVARPYLGKLDLPVRSIEPDEIKPWGLFQARRNGYQHEGLDIGGELGEPILATMDGSIVRAGYQRRGAGNYLVLKQDNIEVTYMHLLREPSRSNYKRLLTREEVKTFGKDPKRGYEQALKRYASLILGKGMESLTAEDQSLKYLREHSLFNQALRAVRDGKSLKVRKGEPIANMGKSGNVTLNSARPEMIYPHIHLEINDGRIDPMQVIEGIGSRWFEIRDYHLNHPFYRNWLKQSHNWSWYSKFYPSGAIPEDKPKG